MRSDSARGALCQDVDGPLCLASFRRSPNSGAARRCDGRNGAAQGSLRAMERVAVLVLFSIACAAGGSPTDADKSVMSKNDAVLAAVYLHELEQASLDASTNVCLAVRGEVTDFAAVLGAVRASFPHAVPDAECSGGGPVGPVVLNAGGSAVRLDIGPITWVDDATARITGGGPHAGGMTVSEREYTVVLDGGDWKVSGEKPGLTI